MAWKQNGPPPYEGAVVFIVGETPTGGIDQTQFDNALGWIRQLRGFSTERELRILGPTFSGSLPSLYRSIRLGRSKDFLKNTKFRISSGSVSSDDQYDAFKWWIPEKFPRLVLRAEEFFVLPYVGFIQNILGQIRTIVLGSVFLFIATTLAVSSYPFDPLPVLGGIFLVIFVITGTTFGRNLRRHAPRCDAQSPHRDSAGRIRMGFLAAINYLWNRPAARSSDDAVSLDHRFCVLVVAA